MGGITPSQMDGIPVSHERDAAHRTLKLRHHPLMPDNISYVNKKKCLQSSVFYGASTRTGRKTQRFE